MYKNRVGMCILFNKISRLSLCRFLFLLLLFSTTSCAFTEGKPWGEAKFQITPVFHPLDRVDVSTHRFRTSSNYQIALEHIEFKVDSVSLDLGKDGSQALSFDPAKPPEGYTLCHNGHCHATDGRLVDYEDIEIEVANQEAKGGAGVQAVFDRSFSFGFGPEPSNANVTGTTLKDATCTGNEHCDLPRGTPRLLKVHLSSMSVKGVAYGGLGHHSLPEAGQSFYYSKAIDVTLLLPVDDLVEVDDVYDIQMKLIVNASILDQLTFDGSTPMFDLENITQGIQMVIANN